MTELNNLRSLRTIAKRFAREHCLAHHDALDLVATRLGYAHWNALTLAMKKGLALSQERIEEVDSSLRLDGPQPRRLLNTSESPFYFHEGDVGTEGQIDGHAYALTIDFGEVHMGGKGWFLMLGQAPSEKPRVEITDRRLPQNPINDPHFVRKALEIAETWRKAARSQVAADWPRRSTKPDLYGRTVHPLQKESGLSGEWFCLHCDGSFTGIQIAKNMWHCPECGATPIDIFEVPFWRQPSKAQ